MGSKNAQEDTKMKRIVFAIALMGILSTGSLFAQAPYWQYQRNDLHRNFVDRNRDERQIDRKEADLAQDQRQLQHELREGDYRAANQLRRDMARDQFQIRQDQRNLTYHDWNRR